MANLRDIRRRIKSVESTKQITKAMEMVSAAKLRRAQSRAESARPYTQKLKKILVSLAGDSDATHPLFEKREVKNTALVVMTGDRGLCGSYNQNVIRAAELILTDHLPENVKLVLIGKRARDYFRRRAWVCRKEYIDFGGNMDFRRVLDIARDITNLFLSHEVDLVKLIYTRFVSTVTYRVTVEDFLPISKPKGVKGDHTQDYIFEPNSDAIYKEILPRFVQNRIYMAFAEALASEHGARMIAMGNATNNAKDMIDNLTLVRNKVRQSSITGELLEIVAGAEALKG
ncbi:MAG: ATP synthase F1 subunit gamma [candidate division Zixibacteria bacterium CG_4_9_14_3_um_filter_46_8]|nr:MAG: ATP synthase F1 subunit gamma [candidate division Zixibacteria bacterium CG_4_9_14_3_um_filter_46_8]